MNEKAFILHPEEKKALLALARDTIDQFVRMGKIVSPRDEEFSEPLRQKCGAFVTLHKAGALRGCIGLFSGHEPLYKSIRDMAIAAATEDPRFPSVGDTEISSIDIEISVLSPLRQIHSIDEIILGQHGIHIMKGSRSGTFLPQVAEETGWTKEEFLGHCSEDKAGLGWDGWKTADLYVYTALVFGEKDQGK